MFQTVSSTVNIQFMLTIMVIIITKFPGTIKMQVPYNSDFL